MRHCCPAPFSWYYDHNRTRFNSFFLGDRTKEDISSFWRTLEDRRDPRLEGHPVKSNPAWRELAVPLAIHGDAVPVLQIGRSGTKSYDAYSLQSLSSAGNTLMALTRALGLVLGADCRAGAKLKTKTKNAEGTTRS